MSNVDKTIEVQGIAVPSFMYGTAWKEDRTQGLTELALETGFRAIDTANQRKHYYEAGVGSAIARSPVERKDLFLQTKFTYRRGQDHRLPYDAAAAPAEQVAQSFESSLEHLGVETIDSYVLHGPSSRYGLTETDWEVWRAMEKLHGEGRTRLIGVSNISLDQLEALSEGAKVMPAFVQNRCFAQLGWDADVRDFCRSKEICYQGFSLLTANERWLFESRAFRGLVAQSGKTWAQVVFRAALQMGMLPLTGTSSRDHMHEDLGVYDFELDAGDLAIVERVAL